ncbi:hypothetical protein Q9L58_004465 [Maublancomyces gigas]|uniref:Uncharacterized protein n=1 Tax=Discina gigas TaxID=1032678 RepID=A0ABR3GKW2_9PEZI
MGLLPNIYYHARTPATSGLGDYTFSRLADATARQNRALKIQKSQVRINKATKDSSQSSHPVNHGYMMVADESPAVGWINSEFIAEPSRISRYARINESSRQPRMTQKGISCGGINKFQYPRKAAGSRCVNPVCAGQRHLCYPGHICHSSQCPGFICRSPMCLALYPDGTSQPTQLPTSAQAQVQRAMRQFTGDDNAWELDSNSDGGVPLDDSLNEDIAVVVDEIVRVIENLQAGYLADTEDGGNGYETHDGDDYGEDDNGDDSDDTIRAWEIHPRV